MSYASIINDNKGVAPLDVPPGSRDLGRSHPDYGSGGLMKSRAQPFSAASSTTLMIELPEEESPDLIPSQPNTVMQVVIQTNGHPNLRGHIIRKLISPHQILLMNYGRSDTWYFSSDKFNVTTMDNTSKQHGPYTLHFTTYHRDKVNGTLRWVPPSLGNDAILKALRIISKKEPTVNDIPFTNNRSFTIFSDTPSIIPHYIKFNYRNRPVNILVAIPGRRQACQSCDSTQHWTSQCPLSSPTAETESPSITLLPQQQTAAQSLSKQQAEPAAKPNDQPTAQGTATPTPTQLMLPIAPPNSPGKVTTAAQTPAPASKRKSENSPTEQGKKTKEQKCEEKKCEEESYYPCDYCDEGFPTGKEAIQHENTKHTELKQCTICKNQTIYNNIAYHYRNFHKTATIKQCIPCEIDLPEENMKAHMAYHHPKP
jgi:hypothetical protein